MNIAQQLIKSLPHRENDSVPGQFEHARIRSHAFLQKMDEAFYLQIVEQRRRYILFTDGSKLCYYRDPAFQLNDDLTGNMEFPDVLFWTIDKNQVENPQPPKYDPTNEFRFWAS